MVDALKKSPSLVYDAATQALLPVNASAQSGSVEIAQSFARNSSAGVQRENGNDDTTGANTTDLALEFEQNVAAEVKHLVCKIRSQAPLALANMIKEVKARTPVGGYTGSDGVPLMASKFYTILKKALKKDVRVVYDKQSGKKAFRPSPQTDDAVAGAATRDTVRESTTEPSHVCLNPSLVGELAPVAMKVIIVACHVEV